MSPLGRIFVGIGSYAYEVLEAWELLRYDAR